MFLPEAESASEGPEAAHGRGWGRDWPTGAQQEEAAERPGRAAGDQRAAAEAAQSSAEWDQASDQNKDERVKQTRVQLLTMFFVPRRKNTSVPLLDTLHDDDDDEDDDNISTDGETYFSSSSGYKRSSSQENILSTFSL